MIRRIAWAWLVVLAALGGCSAGGGTEIRAGGQADGTEGFDPPNPENTTRVTRACEARRVPTWPHYGLNKIVNTASAGIIGRFETIEPPRPSPGVSGGGSGDAVLVVEEVLFDSPALDTGRGERVTVRLGAPDSCGIESYAETTGPVAVGQRNLLLLQTINGKNWITPYTNWRVETAPDGQEQVRANDPQRDAPLEVARARVREERARGLDARRDAGTATRPFDEPSAVNE